MINVFAKAESSPDGLVAAVSGCGAVYVSGGAEHQGPPGGGPIAVVARSPIAD